MDVNGPVCWKCGASIADYPLPLGREDRCRACDADLHACRMCRFYDVTVANRCREPVADLVRDKERANFCGYLEVRAGAYEPGSVDATARAREQLDALFGSEAVAARQPNEEADAARRALDALFKDPGK